MIMTEEPTIPSMGNPRVDAAASRLNEAFLAVTKKLEKLQGQMSEHPEIDLLEKENISLHKENAELKTLLQEMDNELARMAEHIEALVNESEDL